MGSFPDFSGSGFVWRAASGRPSRPISRSQVSSTRKNRSVPNFEYAQNSRRMSAVPGIDRSRASNSLFSVLISSGGTTERVDPTDPDKDDLPVHGDHKVGGSLAVLHDLHDPAPGPGYGQRVAKPAGWRPAPGHVPPLRLVYPGCWLGIMINLFFCVNFSFGICDSFLFIKTV